MNGITTSKHSWQSATRCVLGTVVAALLTACGGGGGGGGGNSDTTAPTVTAVTPLAGASEVALTDTVAVTFSEPVDCTTLTTARFTLVHAGNRAVSGEVACSGQGATFRPVAPLADGVQFTATVKAGVKDAAGNALATDHAWTFTTRARAWKTAELIENHGMGPINEVEVAVDASGNVLAVWEQDDTDAPRSILWNRYTPGAGWGTAQPLETDDANDADDPAVAVDASGNGVAVWMQQGNIWANTYTPGGGWGSAQMLGTGDSAAVSVAPGGAAIVVWVQLNIDHDDVVGSSYLPGSGWSEPQLVETFDAKYPGYLDIAMDSSGNAVAVWQNYENFRHTIWANRYVAGSGWGVAQRIQADDVSDSFDPEIAMDSNGNGIAVWSTNTRNSSEDIEVMANRYTADAGWGTAVVISKDTGYAYAPEIAMDARGNALVVWSQDDLTLYNIVANRYDASTGWGSAQIIDSSDVGNAFAPQIAVDAHGNAVAVWTQTDLTHWNGVANRYTMGAGWGTAAVIESTDDSVGGPVIALDANGDGTALWKQGSSSVLQNIAAIRFE